MTEDKEDQSSRQKKSNFHLAGIIPVAAHPADFEMPWSDALMPIGRNYLAVERAVYECANAGCETIWIICDKSTSPLIRHRIGDWINDPTINADVLKNVGVRFPSSQYKQIPIFYVPIHPKDTARRTGMAWSIIYGYNRAYNICKMFSRWATPAKYFVSFPLGVHSTYEIKLYRGRISSPQSVYIKSPDGKTAKDGEMLPFTFDSSEVPGFKKAFREEEKQIWKSGKWEEDRFVGEKLPPDQRFTGRFLTAKTILKNTKIDETNELPIVWHYDISNWDNYCSFLASPHRKKTRRPGFLKYHEFNPIALNDEDIDEEDV